MAYKQTYIGFVTQHLDKYHTLQAHNKHIVFSDTEIVEDINVIQEIMNISQASGKLQLEFDGDVVKW